MRVIRKTSFLLLLLILLSVQLSTTLMMDRPSTPKNPNPGQKAAGIVRDPILTWSSSNASSYDVYAGNSFPLKKIATVKSPRLRLPSLISDNTRYYWRVVARNIYGFSTGPTWSFTTGRSIHSVSASGVLVGVERGTVNKSYTFSSGEIKCNQGHSVDCRYDWGDGTYSDWSSSKEASHFWDKAGTYPVKARARCSVDHMVVSSWSSANKMVISAKTWTTKRITNNPDDLRYPEIAANGDYLHVLFLDGSTLCYKRSIDGGGTWEARQNLSTSGQINPFEFSYAVAADGPYVHVVVGRTSSSPSFFKIWYRRNTNYGQSGNWGAWRQLTSGTNNFMYPDMVVDGQYVHIVYQGDWPGTYEVFYKRISNYGVGSTLTRRLTWAGARLANIAFSSQYLYVVYQVGSYPNNQLFLKRISNDGSGSIYTKRLTYNSINSEHPDIAAYGQYVFVVFQNEDISSGISDIYSKTIENYGIGTITTKRLTYAGSCDYPAIAFDSGTNDLQAAYYRIFPENLEIFWKVIPNFGKGSYSTYRLTYSTTGQSTMPDILVQDGTTHIVYQDDWPSSYEIFYKRR